MGLLIRSISGEEGRVELAGARAVVGTFLRWTLERRGENPLGEPRWTLRAVFSWQKDSLILADKYRKIIRIKFPPNGPWYEVKPDDGVTLKIEQERLVVEGATCQVVGKPK